MTQSIRPAQPDRSELSLLPLQRVGVVRSPAFGTTASQTGSIVEPVTQIVVLTESLLEKKLVRALMADPNVKSVRHQALRIVYVGEDGERHHHTVDLLVTLRDGRRIGYVVKPEHTAVRDNVRGLVERLAASVSPSKVDRLQLVTSRQLPEWGNQNARQLLNARRDRRSHVDDMLREIAPNLVLPIRIADLTERLGGGHIAFRPVLRAIAFGTLEYLGCGVIDENSRVRFREIRPDLHAPAPVEFECHSLEEPPVIRAPARPKAPIKRASHRTH